MITDESPNSKIYKATLPENVDSSTTLAFTTVYDIGEDILVRSSAIVGITFDPVDKRIYWADNLNNVVSRCDLNGVNYEELAFEGKFMCPL